MRYISTRGKARALGFEDALLAGLAEDGGLYLPESWPALGEVAALVSLPYHEVALRVVAPFIGAEIDSGALARMVRESYAGFDHPDVAPLLAWLRESVHSKGSSKMTDEILAEATGKPLDTSAFMTHLKARYLAN